MNSAFQSKISTGTIATCDFLTKNRLSHCLQAEAVARCGDAAKRLDTMATGFGIKHLANPRGKADDGGCIIRQGANLGGRLCLASIR